MTEILLVSIFWTFPDIQLDSQIFIFLNLYLSKSITKSLLDFTSSFLKLPVFLSRTFSPTTNSTLRLSLKCQADLTQNTKQQVWLYLVVAAMLTARGESASGCGAPQLGSGGRQTLCLVAGTCGAPSGRRPRRQRRAPWEVHLPPTPKAERREQTLCQNGNR